MANENDAPRSALDGDEPADGPAPAGRRGEERTALAEHDRDGFDFARQDDELPLDDDNMPRGRGPLSADAIAPLKAAAMLLRTVLVRGVVDFHSREGDTLADCILTVDSLVGAPDDKSPDFEDALLGALDVITERLLSRTAEGNTETRQLRTLAVIGERMIAALSRDLDPHAAELVTLKRFRSEEASMAALRLVQENSAWLLHPLVVLQVDRWRAAGAQAKRTGYRPVRYDEQRQALDRQAVRLESFCDALRTPPGESSGDRVDVEAFQEVFRDVQKEVAQVRAAYDAWMRSGEVIPEHVTAELAVRTLRKRLKRPTWLADETLLQLCQPRFLPKACIDLELLAQYRHCRKKLTRRAVRRWIEVHVPKPWRAIPRAWSKQLSRTDVADWLNPA